MLPSLLARTLPIAVGILSISGLAACAGNAASDTSTPTFTAPASSTPVSRAKPVDPTNDPAKKYLVSHSYTPDRELVINAHGDIFRVIHSVCTGSADGHCQAIDVFAAGGSTPVWQHSYMGVLQIRSVANGFAVKALNFAPSDPLCCPSLPPVTDAYVWNGRGFIESGQLPRKPGN